MSFALVSCGDDDDEPTTSSSLTINGVKHKVQLFMTWEGEPGEFTVSTLDPDNNVCGFTFEYPASANHNVGTNLASNDLTVTIMDVSDASMSTLDYVSGSLLIKSFGKDTMTVEFKDLKMAGTTFMGATATYTFNGTATVNFIK